MSYKERQPPIARLGRLPAAVFVLIVGVPASFLSFMGECKRPNGLLGPCPREGITFLQNIFVATVLALVITWTTNRMIAALTLRGRPAVWGLAAGFVLAAVLTVMWFALMIAIR